LGLGRKVEVVHLVQIVWMDVTSNVEIPVGNYVTVLGGVEEFDEAAELGGIS